MKSVRARAGWSDLPKGTTVISATDTVWSISEICALMKENIPIWNHEQINCGGHIMLAAEFYQLQNLMDEGQHANWSRKKPHRTLRTWHSLPEVELKERTTAPTTL